MRKRVFLIRHGESLANAGHRTSDPALIALTTTGHQQAQRIAQWFDRAPALIVTSRYLRTQQTAQPTLVRFPWVECQIWEVQEFTYLAPERCFETTAAQRRPLVQHYWERGEPGFVDGPGAESFGQLVARAQNLLQQLQSLPLEQEIAIFTHGQFINLVLWLIQAPAPQLSGAAMQEWRQWSCANPVDNAALFGLELSADKQWRAWPMILDPGPGPPLLMS